MPYSKIYLLMNLYLLQSIKILSLSRQLTKILVFGLYDIGAAGFLLGGTLARLNIIFLIHHVKTD